jgi:hypothetical protein
MEDNHTPEVLDFVKKFECLWNTKSEHYGNKRVRETAAHEIVQLNFTGLTIEGVQMKVRCSASSCNKIRAK